MSEKFTDGPWVTNGDKIETTNGCLRARVAIIDDGLGIEDPEANARLIAAAPDLYAALQLLVESGVTRYHLNTGYAKAALAKAIGQKK